MKAVIVGFGEERRALEAQAAALGVEALFPGPLEHRHLRHLLALSDTNVVPSVFPEAFGMVAAEGAACGSPPIVARHSGLAEIAAGLEEEYPPEYRSLTSFANGDTADLAGKLDDAAVAAPGRAPPLARGGEARGGRALELGARSRL